MTSHVPPPPPTVVTVNAPVDVTITSTVTVNVNTPITVNTAVVPVPHEDTLNRSTILKMKVAQLRTILSNRRLNCKGSKTELVFRLVDAYNL